MSKMTKFFNKVYDVNLCTYYILPLLVLSKSRFGKSFINSYLTRDLKQIVVEVGQPISLYSLENYLAFYGHVEASRETYEDKTLFTYNIPEEWAADVQAFADGRYSQFSAPAKELIIPQSGLAFKRLNDKGQPITDVRLLAILDDPRRRAELRQVMEEQVGMKIPLEAELLCIPKPSNFIDSIQELRSPAMIS